MCVVLSETPSCLMFSVHLLLSNNNNSSLSCNNSFYNTSYGEISEQTLKSSVFAFLLMPNVKKYPQKSSGFSELQNNFNKSMLILFSPSSSSSNYFLLRWSTVIQQRFLVPKYPPKRTGAKREVVGEYLGDCFPSCQNTVYVTSFTEGRWRWMRGSPWSEVLGK